VRPNSWQTGFALRQFPVCPLFGRQSESEFLGFHDCSRSILADLCSRWDDQTDLVGTICGAPFVGGNAGFTEGFGIFLFASQS
jgi:hypothetical protein